MSNEQEFPSHIPHVIIWEIVKRGIPVCIEEEGYRVTDGFYKSGTILLKPNPNGETGGIEEFSAIDRYGGEGYIFDFDDLVRLSYGWWVRSRDRSDGWAQPNERFLDDYLRLKLIEEQVTISYIPTKK